MRRALAIVGVSAGLVIAAGCGGTATTAATGGARTIDAGKVGTLPAVPPASRGPLTVPRGVLRVPGVFPLGSVVVFSVPVRNDSRRALAVDRVDSG